MKRLLLSIILVSGTHVHAAAAARPERSVGQMRTDAELKVNSEVGCKLTALSNELKWEFVKEQDAAIRSSLLAAIKNTGNSNEIALIEAKADAISEHMLNSVKTKFLLLQQDSAEDIAKILAAKDFNEFDQVLACLQWDANY